MTLGFGGGVAMALGYGVAVAVAVTLGGFDSGYVGWGLALWPHFSSMIFVGGQKETNCRLF